MRDLAWGGWHEGVIMADLDRQSEARCICGKVSLRFLRPAPVLHVHCCCADCRQGREWIAREGGPPITRAVTLVDYFVNDLAPVDSDALELLFTVKLRETGRTVRLVTRCCHSVVAIDHPTTTRMSSVCTWMLANSLLRGSRP